MHDLNDIQETYHRWLILQPKLQQAAQHWQQSIALMQTLRAFYLSEDYLAAVSGQHCTSPTAVGNEASILTQDALWQALSDHQKLLWQQLRFAVQHLDPDQNLPAVHEFYTP